MKGDTMTLTKAIEILQDLLGEMPQYPPEDRREAVKLGREALKSVSNWRRFAIIDHEGLLPGETEE